MLTVFGTVHCSTQQLLEPVNSKVRTRLCLSVKSYEASPNHETEQGVSGKTGLGLVFVKSTKPYFMLFFTSCLLSVLLSTTDKTIACKQSTSTENPVPVIILAIHCVKQCLTQHPPTLLTAAKSVCIKHLDRFIMTENKVECDRRTFPRN